jgi:hypothetical protein
MTIANQYGTAQAQPAQKRAVKLSPELSEFLHMLDALEDQLCGAQRQAQ